jgi:hypothetical protein
MVCRKEYLTRLFRQASLISVQPAPQSYAQLVGVRALPNGVPLEKPCSLPIDAIAALAGVSRTTAQNTLRQARHLGLLEVKERRRRGLPSLTNVIKVLSKEWSAWLKLSGGGIGFKKLSPTSIYFNSIEKTVGKDAKKSDTLWRIGSCSAIVPSMNRRGREAAT